MTGKIEKNGIYQKAMSEFVAKRYDRAIELLSEALVNDPDFVMGYTSRGAAFLQKNLFGNAIADFDRAIKADNTYPNAYHLRGMAKERSGDDSGAMADFDRAIELDSEYGAAYYSRGALHIKRGNSDHAVQDMEMVTHLTNRNIEAFANENNLWRSNHLRVEEAMESDMHR